MHQSVLYPGLTLMIDTTILVILPTIGVHRRWTTIGTVQRWVLSSHAIAEISEDFQNAINGEMKSSTPKDLKPSRMLFDEENVNRCQDLIVTWNNTFEIDDLRISFYLNFIFNSFKFSVCDFNSGVSCSNPMKYMWLFL